MNRPIAFLTLILAMFVTSCQPEQISAEPAEEPVGAAQDDGIHPNPIIPLPMGDVVDQQAPKLGYLNKDGNHFIDGSSALNLIAPLEVSLPFQPTWLVGMETAAGTGWLAVADSGEFQAFEVVSGEVHLLDLGVDSLPTGTQPSIYVDGEMLHILSTQDPTASVSSPPVYLASSQNLAYLDNNGDLILTDFESMQRLPLGGLPDARLLVDDDERLLLLGRRTERYAHGVLGDAWEAGSILLLQTQPTLAIISEIELPEHEVLEGVSPIWVDLNGDTEREILVTVSDREKGAYLALYSEDGRQLARSTAIGRAFRWRHQLTAADFLGNREVEIAAVLTPHIGGVLQFFSWEGNQLHLQAEAQGVSSHQIGSGNLDMALSGDFDDDQRLEILLPNTDYDVLGAFQREDDGVLLKWEIPLGSRLSTNLAGIAFKDGGVGFGLGLQSGIVRLWLPD